MSTRPEGSDFFAQLPPFDSTGASIVPKDSGLPEGLETVVIHTDDVDDLMELTQETGWDERADLLSFGGFIGHLEVAQIDWLQLADLRYGSKLLLGGEPPPGCICLALALEVGDFGTYGGDEVVPGFLMLAQGGREYHQLVSQGLRMLLITIPTEILGIPGIEALPRRLNVSALRQQELARTISAGLFAAGSHDGPLGAAASRQRLCQDFLALARDVLSQGLPGLPPCPTDPPATPSLEATIRSTLARVYRVRAAQPVPGQRPSRPGPTGPAPEPATGPETSPGLTRSRPSHRVPHRT